MLTPPKAAIEISVRKGAAAIVLPLLLAAGCAHAPPAPSAHLGLRGVLADVPMKFKVPAFLGVFRANVHVPVVDVRVNGESTRFIVDTGSTHNVITTQLAKELGITLRRSKETGRDHAGASVAVYETSPLRIAVASHERELRDVLAIDAPAPLERFGIGGFLSPQTFVERGCVVLDLPGKRLLVTTDSLADIRQGHSADRLRMTTVPRERVDGVDDRKLLVTVSLRDRDPAVAELDTGARRTEFVTSYLGVADASAGQDGGLGVSGQQTKGRLVQGQYVRFGTGTSGPMDVLARNEIRKDEGVISAVLGIDVLERFVVVVPAEPSEELLIFESNQPK